MRDSTRASTVLLTIGGSLAGAAFVADAAVAPSQPLRVASSAAPARSTLARAGRPRPRGGRFERVPFGPVHRGRATVYSYGCDPTGGGATTASGTRVRFGEVAEMGLPLGTRIRVSPPIHGRRLFRIEDRFGGWHPTGDLDVWMPCPWVRGWANPTVTWRAYRLQRVYHERLVLARGPAR